MAITKTALGIWKDNDGIHTAGPTKVIDANEEDLSTPDVSQEYDTDGVERISYFVKFANYTSVTVKLQRSLDGVTWDDVGTAITASGNIEDVAPEAPKVRLSVAGTLSVGADTLEVWMYMRRAAY